MLVYRLMGPSAQERQVSQRPYQTLTGDVRIFLVTAGPTEHVQRNQESENGTSRTQRVKGRWSTEMIGPRAFLEKFHQLKGSVL